MPKKSKSELSKEFDWIPIYEEIRDKLIELRNSKNDLLKILKDMEQQGLHVIDTSEIPDIDPFTFFANFNRRVKHEKRKEILSYLKKIWGLNSDVPQDFNGIPRVHTLKSKFTKKAKQKNYTVSNQLWELLMNAKNDSQRGINESFDICLNFEDIRYNLTIGLFWMFPEKFLPLDQKTRGFLVENMGYVASNLDISNMGYQRYKDIMRQVSQKYPDKSFPEISYMAFKENYDVEGLGDPNYWRIRPGKNGVYWDKWMQENIIALGWPEIDPTVGYIEEQVKKKGLGDDPSYVRGRFEEFYDRMAMGDIVVVVAKNKIRIGEIVSDYYYDSRQDFPHIREIKWLTNVIDISSFEKGFIRRIKHIYTINELWEEDGRIIDGILNDYGYDNSNNEEFAAEPQKPYEEYGEESAKSFNQQNSLRNTNEFRIQDLYFTDQEKSNIESQIHSAIMCGKHIILLGPPGTGKSKLAQEICEHYMAGNYRMCTATSDWSTFDTIGGYMQEKDGALVFRPGLFLECFREKEGENKPTNKWLLIDEINRADIDKAFGALFSALANDSVTLAFREKNGKNVKILSKPEGEQKISEETYPIHCDWRIIATMNTYDKASLYEMSYAFMRRFAFIGVSLPDEPDVSQYLQYWANVSGGNIDEETVNEIWQSVNKFRKVGPAIMEDLCKHISQYEKDYTSAIAMYVLPQFEGTSEDEVKGLIEDLKSIGQIEHDRLIDIASEFFEIPKEALQNLQK